jgi:hypothetical protein
MLSTRNDAFPCPEYPTVATIAAPPVALGEHYLIRLDGDGDLGQPGARRTAVQLSGVRGELATTSNVR